MQKICNKYAPYMQKICRKYAENMHLICKKICRKYARICIGAYSAYLAYICTPHFADGSLSGLGGAGGGRVLLGADRGMQCQGHE
jgi:hypothetical protein